MDTDFYLEVLNEAMTKFSKPEIFNTDQGSQFTSPRFTEQLLNARRPHSALGGRTPEELHQGVRRMELAV